jgi:orotate phosphoribosyltransferase
MTWAKQNEFNQFLTDKNVVGFFEAPVTLKSGRQSNWYVNFRTIAEDALLLDLLSDYVVDFLSYLINSGQMQSRPLCLYGVPEGASKAAIIAQMKWAKSDPNYGEGSHPVPMGRAKPKEHGMPKDKFFVGAPRGQTVVLEDVTTTAGSLLKTLANLKEANVDVSATLGLANRMEKRDDGFSAEEAIQRFDYGAKPLQYFYMSSALDLLPLAAAKIKPNPKILSAIEKEFDEYGVSTLKF